MAWKEFLKSDWRKIVLAIVIFTILINIKIFPIKIVGGWTERIEYVSLISELTHTYYGSFEKIFESIGLVIIFLLVSYLLSCLIVWIHDNKLRKVKKK